VYQLHETKKNASAHLVQYRFKIREGSLVNIVMAVVGF